MLSIKIKLKSENCRSIKSKKERGKHKLYSLHGLRRRIRKWWFGFGWKKRGFGAMFWGSNESHHVGQSKERGRNSHNGAFLVDLTQLIKK